MVKKKKKKNFKIKLYKKRSFIKKKKKKKKKKKSSICTRVSQTPLLPPYTHSHNRVRAETYPHTTLQAHTHSTLAIPVHADWDRHVKGRRAPSMWEGGVDWPQPHHTCTRAPDSLAFTHTPVYTTAKLDRCTHIATCPHAQLYM
jgi:hypothetical protein